MKNYDQSKKAKEEFLENSRIAQYMIGDPTRIFLREQLALVFNENDRQIRREVAELANYVPVISLSKDKGYRVFSFNDETPVEELVKMNQQAQHQVAEFRSRIDNLKARMKPLIAFQKVIEKKLEKLDLKIKVNGDKEYEVVKVEWDSINECFFYYTTAFDEPFCDLCDDIVEIKEKGGDKDEGVCFKK